MQISDYDLLLQAQSEYEDGDAFEKILLRYERLILHVTRRYFPSTEDALDASQEAALKIYNGLSAVKIDEDGNLKAWICTVTARCCLDSLRKKRPQTTELTDDVVPASAPSAEESAQANERVHEILSAIKKLPESHRMIIILRDMQQLSYDEIAEALEISVGTVKSRLSRARAGLKDLLEGL